MTPSAPTDTRTLAVGTALVFGGLVVFGAGGLGLAWDGSWFAFRTADLGQPTFLHGRVLGWIVQAPALLVRPFVDDPLVFAAVLGLCFVAVPAVALLACWRVLAPDRHDLLVYPVLGIGLAGLPGQALALSEALMAVNLAWPLVLAAALGRLDRHRVLAALLVVALALAHPFAVPILAGVAGIVALRAWRRPVDRRTTAAILVALAAVIAVLLLRYLLFATTYEAETLSLGRLSSQFRGGIAGAPLVAIVVSILLAIWLAFAPPAGRIGRIVAVAAVVVAAGVLTRWAADPAAWEGGLMFRTFALFVQAPLWAIAALTVVYRPEPAAGRTEAGPARWVVLAVGATVLVVGLVQTLSWRGLTDDLVVALRSQPDGCVEARDLPIERSALDHWGLTTTALMLEGRAPRHLVAIGLPCAALDATGGIPTKIVEGVVVDRAPANGWFDLRAIELGAEPTSAP